MSSRTLLQIIRKDEKAKQFWKKFLGKDILDELLKYPELLSMQDVKRAKIAKEEKVPPYIVFSDKTLVQMCIEKPTNKNAMLKVSGVGEFKFEKYGERFLEVIRSWT